MNAATPHRRNMYSPSRAPSRRVLGDIVPMSINTPTNPTNKVLNQCELIKGLCLPKQAPSPLGAAFGNKENHSKLSAHSKGKKRGIEEVETAESAERLKMLARTRDETLSDTGMGLTSAAMQRHAETDPIGPAAEPGSPTECNTPSPSPEPILSQRSNQSFSDFLNFDQCASQTSEHGVAVEQVRTSAPKLAAVNGKKSRAEQLRTRLRFGLYKVKTNQVGKRDAEIISRYEISASRSANAPKASSSSAITSSAEARRSYDAPHITVSSSRRVQEPVFIKANLDPFRPISKLKAPPIQFVIPLNDMAKSSHTLNSFDVTSSSLNEILPR